MGLTKLAMTFGLVAIVGCGGGTPATTTTPPPPTKGNGPCKQIIQACEQAGFEKGEHKTDGKGLYKDCMTPVLAGQTVTGVTVDPAVVSSCQEARAKHQQMKQAAPPPTTPQ